jgi:hypothetical protein
MSFGKGLSRERSARCKEETKGYSPEGCLKNPTCFPMCLLHNCASLLQTLRVLNIPEYITILPTTIVPANPKTTRYMLGTSMFTENLRFAMLTLTGVPTRFVPPFTPFLKSVTEERKAPLGNWTLQYSFRSTYIDYYPLVGNHSAEIPGKKDLQSFCELLQKLHTHGVVLTGHIYVWVRFPKDYIAIWKESVKRVSLLLVENENVWTLGGFVFGEWLPDGRVSLQKHFEIPPDEL